MGWSDGVGRNGIESERSRLTDRAGSNKEIEIKRRARRQRQARYMPQPADLRVLLVAARNAAVTIRRAVVVHIHLGGRDYRADAVHQSAIHRQDSDIPYTLAIGIHAAEAERVSLGFGAGEKFVGRNLRDAGAGALAVGFDHPEVAGTVENDLVLIRIDSRGQSQR